MPRFPRGVSAEPELQFQTWTCYSADAATGCIETPVPAMRAPTISKSSVLPGCKTAATSSTHWLLQPGHVEHVWGFAALRSFLEWLYRQPLSPLALASNINGLYAGLVYLTPLGGGFLADRVIGRTNAVTLGAVLMVIGGFLM